MPGKGCRVEIRLGIWVEIRFAHLFRTILESERVRFDRLRAQSAPNHKAKQDMHMGNALCVASYAGAGSAGGRPVTFAATRDSALCRSNTRLNNNGTSSSVNTVLSNSPPTTTLPSPR